jgi:hypothetical protein
MFGITGESRFSPGTSPRNLTVFRFDSSKHLDAVMGNNPLGAAMDKEQFEHLVRLVTSKGNDDRVLNRDASRGDVSMWGKIAVDQAGGIVGDWLIGSWSVADGTPLWVPRMHYYSREDRKFYKVQLNIDS